MSYNMQGYYEQDKVCYSEQEGYGRSGYGMPRHHNRHMGASGWTDQVTECESYSAGRVGGGYNHGGFMAPASQGYDCYERKEEMCMAQNGGGYNHGGFGRRGARIHRRRVMRHSVSRGEYSSSESDSD